MLSGMMISLMGGKLRTSAFVRRRKRGLRLDRQGKGNTAAFRGFRVLLRRPAPDIFLPAFPSRNFVDREI